MGFAQTHQGHCPWTPPPLKRWTKLLSCPRTAFAVSPVPQWANGIFRYIVPRTRPRRARRGGARKRAQFSTSGGNGTQRTWRRRWHPWGVPGNFDNLAGFALSRIGHHAGINQIYICWAAKINYLIASSTKNFLHAGCVGLINLAAQSIKSNFSHLCLIS